MSQSLLRLGTRDSALAMWQAKKVQSLLAEKGQEVELVPIKSEGDIELEKPLYELGITGIFTKSLDLALIQNKIDFAVHSLKDVPTALAHGLKMWAVLERADHRDVLIHKGADFLEDEDSPATIATGSLRRQAQWLHQFPQHQVTNLRGNVQTRLQKLQDEDWQGAIFALAGLERMELVPEKTEFLDWMIPAPAQGAIAVVGRESDTATEALLSQINHQDTRICVEAERRLLRELEGGCTAPIGAYASLQGEEMTLKAGLFSLDGQEAITAEDKVSKEQGQDLAIQLAKEIKAHGGDAILEALRNG